MKSGKAKDNRIDRIKAKTLGKSNKGNSQPIDSPDMLIRLHHIFMVTYGWIPLEEFKKLPIPTFWNLLAEINQDAEDQHKAMEKAKHKKW